MIDEVPEEDLFLMFDELPSSALVDIKIVARLFDCSPSTVWRMVRRGELDEPQRRGGMNRWRVGYLREVLGE